MPNEKVNESAIGESVSANISKSRECERHTSRLARIRLEQQIGCNNRVAHDKESLVGILNPMSSRKNREERLDNGVGSQSAWSGCEAVVAAPKVSCPRELSMQAIAAQPHHRLLLF